MSPADLNKGGTFGTAGSTLTRTEKYMNEEHRISRQGPLRVLRVEAFEFPVL
jgi:hypothetical protein